MADDFPSRPEPPLTIAVSECLLGAAVRYDGTDSRSEFSHKALDGLFNYRGICPEVGIGLGVPRAPIRLELKGSSLRVVGVTNPQFDVTDKLTAFARQKVVELDDVAGYVFMEKSPSCGLFQVKIFPSRSVGRGIYAQTIVEHCPNLPVEENGRLHDSLLRECFVARVFAYAHWQALVGVGLTVAGLREFQERYECLLMAHSVLHYRSTKTLLGMLDDNLQSLSGEYLGLLMAGLCQPARRDGHARALARILSRMQKHIGRAGCKGFERLINRYRRGEEPLEVLFLSLACHLRQHPDPYIEGQVYLQPVKPVAAPTS